MKKSEKLEIKLIELKIEIITSINELTKYNKVYSFQDDVRLVTEEGLIFKELVNNILYVEETYGNNVWENGFDLGDLNIDDLFYIFQVIEGYEPEPF